MLSSNHMSIEENYDGPVFVHSFEQIGAEYSWQDSADALGTTVTYLKRVSKMSRAEQGAILSSLRQKKSISDQCSRIVKE